jgi:hypothetical protein
MYKTMYNSMNAPPQLHERLAKCKVEAAEKVYFDSIDGSAAADRCFESLEVPEGRLQVT